MLIEDNRKNFVLYKDIKSGQVFKNKLHPDLYMKIDPFGSNAINCIKLSDGQLSGFLDGAECIIINGKFVVE